MGNFIISAPCKHCFNKKHNEFIDKQMKNTLSINIILLAGIFVIKYGSQIIDLTAKIKPSLFSSQ